MKTQKNKLQFGKSSITELQINELTTVKGGTISVGPTKDCTLCINSSNGPGGTILQELNQA